MTSNLGAESFQRGAVRARAGDAAARRGEAQRHFVEAVQRLPPAGDVQPPRPHRAVRAAGPRDDRRRSPGASWSCVARRDGVRLRGVELDRQRRRRRPPGRRGFDPRYGARPLKRAIERELLAPLAEALNRYAGAGQARRERRRRRRRRTLDVAVRRRSRSRRPAGVAPASGIVGGELATPRDAPPPRASGSSAAARCWPLRNEIVRLQPGATSGAAAEAPAAGAERRTSPTTPAGRPAEASHRRRRTSASSTSRGAKSSRSRTRAAPAHLRRPHDPPAESTPSIDGMQTLTRGRRAAARAVRAQVTTTPTRSPSPSTASTARCSRLAAASTTDVAALARHRSGSHWLSDVRRSRAKAGVRRPSPASGLARPRPTSEADADRLTRRRRTGREVRRSRSDDGSPESFDDAGRAIIAWPSARSASATTVPRLCENETGHTRPSDDSPAKYCLVETADGPLDNYDRREPARRGWCATRRAPAHVRLSTAKARSATRFRPTAEELGDRGTLDRRRSARRCLGS